MVHSCNRTHHRRRSCISGKKENCSKLRQYPVLTLYPELNFLEFVQKVKPLHVRTAIEGQKRQPFIPLLRYKAIEGGKKQLLYGHGWMHSMYVRLPSKLHSYKVYWFKESGCTVTSDYLRCVPIVWVGAAVRAAVPAIASVDGHSFWTTLHPLLNQHYC